MYLSLVLVSLSTQSVNLRKSHLAVFKKILFPLKFSSITFVTFGVRTSFIFRLFSDAVRNSGYAASNGGMDNELKWMCKQTVVADLKLFTPSFACTN